MQGIWACSHAAKENNYGIQCPVFHPSWHGSPSLPSLRWRCFPPAPTACCKTIIHQIYFLSFYQIETDPTCNLQIQSPLLSQHSSVNLDIFCFQQPTWFCRVHPGLLAWLQRRRRCIILFRWWLGLGRAIRNAILLQIYIEIDANLSAQTVCGMLFMNPSIDKPHFRGIMYIVLQSKSEPLLVLILNFM